MDEQDPIAALVKFDERERPGRIERLREVIHMLGDRAEEGFWHSGRLEAAWILSEAKDAYVYGCFIASLFASHAACERRLAGRVSMAAGPERPRGFDRWGLGKLVEWCLKTGWISRDLAVCLYDLSEKRKKLAHFRISFQPDDQTSRSELDPTVLKRVAMEVTDEEWSERLVSLLQTDARSALTLAYDVCYDLSGSP
jgi:hypothetical protein